MCLLEIRLDPWTWTLWRSNLLAMILALWNTHQLSWMGATRVCLGFLPDKPPKANDYQEASAQRDRLSSHMCQGRCLFLAGEHKKPSKLFDLYIYSAKILNVDHGSTMIHLFWLSSFCLDTYQSLCHSHLSVVNICWSGNTQLSFLQGLYLRDLQWTVEYIGVEFQIQNLQ